MISKCVKKVKIAMVPRIMRSSRSSLSFPERRLHPVPVYVLCPNLYLLYPCLFCHADPEPAAATPEAGSVGNNWSSAMVCTVVATDVAEPAGSSRPAAVAQAATAVAVAEW